MKKPMKNHKLKYLTTLVVTLSSVTNLGASILVGLSLGNAATSFDDSASPNGIYWNRTPSNASAPSIADLIGANDGLATGIAFSTVNAGGFYRNVDSLPLGPIIYDGIRFPNETLSNGIANNFGNASRNGLIVFSFVIPANLVSQNGFNINAVLGSNNASQGAEFNVGGTWGGTGDRRFTGGTTIDATGNTSTYTFVTLSDIQAVFDSVADTYTLELQFGYTSASNGGVMAVRGITIAAIPEPSTYAVFAGLAVLGLVIYRRRRS